MANLTPLGVIPTKEDSVGSALGKKAISVTMYNLSACSVHRSLVPRDDKVRGRLMAGRLKAERVEGSQLIAEG
jgi:hypothetical protein